MSVRRSAHHTFLEQHGVPVGWDAVRLRDLVNIVGGGTPDSGEPSYWNGSTPWLTPTEMATLKGRFAMTSERRLTEAGVERSNCRLLPVGSLVLSTRGTVGSVAMAGVPLTCNQSCEALLPKDGLDPEYLYYLLTYIRPLVERFGAGTTFSSVTRRDIRDIYVAIPTPDSSEQRLIADILVLMDDAIAAAEAKLMAARRLKTALMQQLFTRGIPGRHSRFKQTKIGEIPESWEVGRISRMLAEDVYNGVSPKSHPEPPGRPILNVSCISAGKCDPAYHTYVDIEGEVDPSLLSKPGDFYVLRGNGNRAFVATGGLLTRTPPEGCIFSDLLIKIPFAPDKTAAGFMPLLWQSQLFLRLLQAKAVSGSGLWKIGLREIRRHEFPLPSIEE